MSSQDPAPRLNLSQKLSQLEHIRRYEALRQKLQDQTAQALQGAASELVQENLQEMQDLYNVVRLENNRDTRVHLKDSEVFKEASDLAAINARNLKFDKSGITLNLHDTINQLRKFMGGNSIDEGETDAEEQYINNGHSNSEETFNRFDWLKLGTLYYKVSRKLVVNDFMYGPLATERKKPVVRARNIDDTKSSDTTTTASRVVASELTTDEEKNTSYMVKSVYQTFKEKDDGNGISFFRFFINPQSFSQSVENLFFASFLVKDARLNVYKDENGNPFIKGVDAEEHAEAQQHNQNTETVHHVALFDYYTWQRLVEKHNITSSFLGHRRELEDTMDPQELADDDDHDKAAEPESEPYAFSDAYGIEEEAGDQSQQLNGNLERDELEEKDDDELDPKSRKRTHLAQDSDDSEAQSSKRRYAASDDSQNLFFLATE